MGTRLDMTSHNRGEDGMFIMCLVVAAYVRRFGPIEFNEEEEITEAIKEENAFAIAGEGPMVKVVTDPAELKAREKSWNEKLGDRTSEN